ncbi:MAG: hypothetical protein A4E53_03870 [Pelotomaculum sp. PtaB.Bin104]|nr:MAG: hypothetical protein A4E53_03870 [Pelotomaculum sp. PtaB.Bin104]
MAWIIFSYRTPTEPSTLRVRAWRTLKALGVVYIQQSVCVAPDTPEVRKRLEQIQKQINDSGGESLLLEVANFAQSTEEYLIDAFNSQRLLEYEEFYAGCNNFLKEIDMEMERENFTFREVEENEADLMKLRKWYRRVMKRDYFITPKLTEAKSKLDLCESVLLEFTNKVYQSEGYSEGQILQEPL